MSKKILTNTQLVYTTSEAIKAMRCSSRTFYIHAKKLNITPKKKANCRNRFWPYDDLINILMSIYNTPKKVTDLTFELLPELEKADKGITREMDLSECNEGEI